MQEACFCFTVDDVGMEGYSTPAHLEKLLEFCDAERIKATLFVVPRPLGKVFPRREYARLLEQAQCAGHAVGQHGLEHGRFELGIPPKMVLDLAHETPAREYLASHREEIEQSLTVDKIRSRLREGRAILEDIVGGPIDGFRAPCLSVCDNLFIALESEGYRYDSSKFLQKGGWDLINEKENPAVTPITHEKFVACQNGGRMRIFPLTTDYTWYLPQSRFEASLHLAIHDYEACLASGFPFVPISHVSPIHQGEADCGLSLYRKLLAHARDAAQRRGMRFAGSTLGEAARLGNDD